MGYNVSFKIRDDQVALGDIIMDKNGAQLLSEIFIQAKQNQGFSAANLGVMWQIVNEWCFTDDEFVKLKNEFEQIKVDIAKFKELVASFSVKWISGIQELGATVDWIAGSTTWVEKYKENKKIAASLYNELKRKGYQFSVAEQQIYDQRYWDVTSSCTQTELVREYLEREKREAMANGDPHANERFAAAMVETGCFTPEQAEEHMRLARMWDQIAGNGVQKHIVTEVENGRAKESYTSGNTESKPKNILITQAILLDMWERVNNIYDDPAAQDTCAYILLEVMKRVYEESEIPTEPPAVRDPMNPWECSQSFMNVLGLNQNQGLIDTASVVMSGEDYKKIMDLTFQVPGVETGVADGYITATAELVNKWYGIISNNNDDAAIIKFCEILASCLSVADIDFTDVVNRQDNISDKRSRLSSLVALINQNKDRFDNACTQVVYDKLDKALRSA